MWSSWFPNGIFPTRRNKNPNIQKRICGLFEAKMFTPKDSSPMLKELQSCRSKVRRMSSVYEGNIAAYNENIRNDETQRKSLPEQLEAAKEPPQMFVASFPEYESDAIHLIQFILDSDTNYIKRMEVMIEKHVKAFECILALCLKGEDSITNRQKTELFGPIESIHNFHKEIFHPQLLACQHDVVLFAKKISEMCTSGCFNQYLVYGMDEKVNSRHEIEVYESSRNFFFRIANTVEPFTTNSSSTRSPIKLDSRTSSLPSSSWRATVWSSSICCEFCTRRMRQWRQSKPCQRRTSTGTP